MWYTVEDRGIHYCTMTFDSIGATVTQKHCHSTVGSQTIVRNIVEQQLPHHTSATRHKDIVGTHCSTMTLDEIVTMNCMIWHYYHL
jgi:hypothetical protein